MKLVKTLWWIFLLMPSGCLFAQPAPTIVSTLQTTDPGATSVSVGCAVGSSTCTGGISFGSAAGNTISLSGGYLEIQSNVPVSQTFRLVNNSGTLQWNGTPLAAGSSVSGTTGTIAVFTGPSAIGNSICTQASTTLTCVNTVSATTLTGTLSTASQPNVTGVGTLTTAIWNATKIGLTYGGTNADLSGTGGTSQFLRQNSSGAAITVVRPAIADLSDGTNVALLNAVNTFTAQGTQTWTTGSAGGQTLKAINTAAGTGNFSSLILGTDADASLGRLQAGSSTFTTSGAFQASVLTLASNGVLNLATTGASALNVYTNNLVRWGINSAGDFTVGASADIADSSGTPTIASGFGTSPAIVGTDYAFRVTQGSTTTTGGTINFGHTWTTIPICTVSNNASPGAIDAYPGSLSTTQLQIITVNSANAKIYVLCRSY